MWKLSSHLLLTLLLLSANRVYILLPTAASDFVTFSRFLKKKKKRKVLTGRGFIYNAQLILRV